MQETSSTSPPLDDVAEWKWLIETGVILSLDVESDPEKNYGPLICVESNPPADKVAFVLDAFAIRRMMPLPVPSADDCLIEAMLDGDWDTVAKWPYSLRIAAAPW